MKNLTVFLKGVIVVLAVLILPSGCGGNGGSDSLPPDENIVSIHLMYFWQHYHEGETFNTRGNKLWVHYVDRTTSYIDSGFTLEWSLEPDDGYYEKRWEWYYDDNAWKPIRHGDILPVSPPSNFPMIPSATFYVQADYKGMKSGPSFVSVYRQGYPLPEGVIR